MENIYSIDCLKAINKNILRNTYSEEELSVCLKELSLRNSFEDLYLNNLIFSIILLVEDHVNTPLLDLSLNMLKSKMILAAIASTDNLTSEEETVQYEDKKEKACCENNKPEGYCVDVDECLPDDITETDSEKIKAFFLKKYPRFLELEGKPLNLPKKGEYAFISLRDNITYPDRTFFVKFKIDHTGTTLGIEQFIEKNNQKDLDLIYAGLAGQIQKYQEAVANFEL